MVKLSIIVISYNTVELTLNCLRSVFEQTRANVFEVIVLDNASHDGSADAIQHEFGSRLKLIRSEKNLGFARANNLATSGSCGDYLLLLNPDTIIFDGATHELVKFAEAQPEAGIWGGRTVFADHTLNPSSCWRRMTVWSLVCRAVGLTAVFPGWRLCNAESYGGWTRDLIRCVDIVTGCFLLIRRDLWNKLGGFDERFFMYGEDADLCLRARKMGYRPMITPDATIVHYGGASDVVKADKLVRLLTAKMLLIRKHWTPASAAVGVRLLAMWPLRRAFVEWAFQRSRGGPWREVWSRRREWYGT